MGSGHYSPSGQTGSHRQGRTEGPASVFLQGHWCLLGRSCEASGGPLVCASQMRVSSSLGPLGPTRPRSFPPSRDMVSALSAFRLDVWSLSSSGHHHVMRLDQGTEGPGLSLWFFQGSPPVLSHEYQALWPGRLITPRPFKEPAGEGQAHRTWDPRQVVSFLRAGDVSLKKRILFFTLFHKYYIHCRKQKKNRSKKKNDSQSYQCYQRYFS